MATRLDLIETHSFFIYSMIIYHRSIPRKSEINKFKISVYTGSRSRLMLNNRTWKKIWRWVELSYTWNKVKRINFLVVSTMDVWWTWMRFQTMGLWKLWRCFETELKRTVIIWAWSCPRPTQQSIVMVATSFKQAVENAGSWQSSFIVVCGIPMLDPGLL